MDEISCAHKGWPCARGLCTNVVRNGCARRGCAHLCAQRRMVVHGDCAQGCARTVRSPGAKSCALRTAQGFSLVQKSTFRTGQGFEPCAYFISLFLVPLDTVWICRCSKDFVRFYIGLSVVFLRGFTGRGE